MSGVCVLGRGHVRLVLFGFGTCIWTRLEYLESTVAPPPLVYDIHTYSTLLEIAYRHAHGYTLVLRPEHAGHDMVIRWHARLGVVSAKGSPVSADFAFPGAFAGWAGGVENGPVAGGAITADGFANPRLRGSGAGLVSTTVRSSTAAAASPQAHAHACVVAGMHAG